MGQADKKRIMKQIINLMNKYKIDKTWAIELFDAAKKLNPIKFK